MSPPENSNGAPSRLARAETPGLRERIGDVDFPIYGLDGGWSGRRWLSVVCAGADGLVEYVSLGHGDEPNRRPDEASPRRFVTVVTVPRRERRRSPDGAIIEATSRTGVASIAGVALLADSWPWQIDRELRGDWMRQQTEIAWELADHLEGDEWEFLPLPIEGVPERLRYRESEYGWVFAGATSDAFVGGYGRGISAHGLGLQRIDSLLTYDDPASSNGVVTA
jgi:hypothetical protein